MSTVDDRPVLGMGSDNSNENNGVASRLLRETVYGTDIKADDCYEFETFDKLFTDKGIAVVRALPVQNFRDTAKFFSLTDVINGGEDVSHVVTQHNYVPYFGMDEGKHIAFFAGYPSADSGNIKYGIKFNPYVVLSRIISAGKKNDPELAAWAAGNNDVGYLAAPKSVVAFYAHVYRSTQVTFTNGSRYVSNATYFATDGYPKGFVGKVQIALMSVGAWKKIAKKLSDVSTSVNPDTGEVTQSSPHKDPFLTARTSYIYLFNNGFASSFCKNGGVPNPITGAGLSDEKGYSIELNPLYYPMAQEAAFLQAKFSQYPQLMVNVAGSQGQLPVPWALNYSNELPAEWLQRYGGYLRRHDDVLDVADNEQTMDIMAEYAPLACKLCYKHFKGPIRQLLERESVQAAIASCQYEDIFEYANANAPMTQVNSGAALGGAMGYGIGGFTPGQQQSPYTQQQYQQPQQQFQQQYQQPQQQFQQQFQPQQESFGVQDLPQFTTEGLPPITSPAASTPANGAGVDGLFSSVPAGIPDTGSLPDTLPMSGAGGPDELPFNATQPVPGLNPDAGLPPEILARIEAEKQRSLGR